jgi:tetratricopeptide (TPR) repeat protein
MRMFGVNELKKIFMLVLGLVVFGIILNLFTGEEQPIVSEEKRINIIDEEKKATDDMARTLYISLEFNSLVEDINTTNITSELLPKYKQRIDNIKSVIDQDETDTAWNESAKQELDKIYEMIVQRSVELSFDELFDKYATPEHKVYCKDKGKEVKVYYLAKDLENINPELSIKYYKTALELNSQEVAKWALYENIAYLYYVQKDYMQSVYWYEKVKELDGDIYNVNLALAYEGLGNYQKAFEILKQGYAKKDRHATHQLGTYYYNGIIEKLKDTRRGGELWLEAYHLYKEHEQHFTSEITYNLGIYYVDTMKNYEKGRYFFAVSALAGDNDASDILVNDSKVYSLDMSKFFLDEVVKNGKFVIKEIASRYRGFYDEKAFLYTPNSYEIDNVRVLIDDNKIRFVSQDKDKLKKYLGNFIDILYVDKYKETAKSEFTYIVVGANVNLRGLNITISKEDRDIVCEIKAKKD